MRDNPTVESDGATGHMAPTGEQTDDRMRRRGFTRTRLTDDRDSLPRVNVEVDSEHRRYWPLLTAKGDIDVAHLQQRAGIIVGVVRADAVLGFIRGLRLRGVSVRRMWNRCHEAVRSFGSRASFNASPSMMKPSTVMARAPAG